MTNIFQTNETCGKQMLQSQKAIISFFSS